MHTYILIFGSLPSSFHLTGHCGGGGVGGCRLIPKRLTCPIAHSKLFTGGCIIITVSLQRDAGVNPLPTAPLPFQNVVCHYTCPLARWRSRFPGNLHRHLSLTFIQPAIRSAVFPPLLSR